MLGQIRSSENGGGQGNGNANVRNGVTSQGHEDAGDEEDNSTLREGEAVGLDYQALYE